MADLRTDPMDVGPPAEAPGGDPHEAEQLAELPLWRVRLRLFRKAFAKNWELFVANKMGVVGLVVIAIFGIMALSQPILMDTLWKNQHAVYDPIRGNDTTVVQKTIVNEVTDPATQIDILTAMTKGNLFPQVGEQMDVALPNPAPPSRRHLLGTDPFGRDILSQLLYGSKAAFALGITAAIVTVFLATTIGSVAAYFGGIVDTYLMRQADLLLIVPLLPLLIVVSSFYQIGLMQLAIMIGILSGLGGTAIILKSQALAVKVKPFIDAARVAGGSRRHIIFRHIVPNVMPLSFLYMMFEVTGAIFLEATLSYFGLLQIPMSWGIMINVAHTQGYTLSGLKTWWLLLPAGLAVTLISAAFFMVGRAMDEVINPRLRRR